MSPIRASLPLLLACVAAACSRAPARRAAEPGRDEPSAATVVRGSCANASVLDAEGLAHPGARPTGPPSGYPLTLRVQPGAVRVRANAMWPAEDHRNVIGSIEGGSLVRAAGPLRDAEVSSGIGYAITVEDSAGARCRGYLSMSVVEPAQPAG